MRSFGVGVLFVDAYGQIKLATGVGRDARVQATVKNEAWLADMQTSRLREFIIDGTRYCVLLTAVADGNLFVFSQADEPLLDFLGSVDFAFDVLTQLITDPFEAITVVDKKGRLVYLSPVHEKFFGLRRGEGMGKPVTSVIENTRLNKVVETGRAEIGAIQHMNGIERIVSRVPVRQKGEIVGAIGRVMFKGRQQVQDLNRTLENLESQVEFYRKEAATLRRQTYELDAIIGESAPVRRLRQEIKKLAPLDTSVLILGESGTGKELIAHALHNLSARRAGSLVALNASAMPSNLIEAELFGYDGGSFTGADKKGRKGKFEHADNGTLFLDEIGDMAIDVQPKLLRVLQERVIQRVGGDRSHPVNFRLVCATNSNLRNQIANGKFRLDLYYRISVITLEAPSLRHRLEDIPLLVDHFLRDLANRHGMSVPKVTNNAIDWLMNQDWPGNVRQLRHEVERAFVFCEGDEIGVDLVSHRSGEPLSNRRAEIAPGHLMEGSIKEATERLENSMIAQAVLKFNGNKKRVAEELGISRSYLYKKLEELASESTD